MSRALGPEEMWKAFQSGDRAFDGRFWTGVRTTGIFCKPSCRARLPLRKNVEFFETSPMALRAGYRPCKRCRPLQGPGHIPEWAQGLIDRVSAQPAERVSDADLRNMDIDPVRTRRWFQARFGVTFHGWQRAWRLSGAVRALRAGERLDDLPARAAYASPSGFRDAFAKLFGSPPGRAREAFITAAPLLAHWIETPLGPMIAVATEIELVLCEFIDRRGLETQLQTVARRFARPAIPGQNAVLNQAAAQLAEYFAGQRRSFDIPIQAPGTPFEEQIWKALLCVPYGSTTTYAALAEATGRPGAARATGRANGANRLAIFLPCHRVIGSDGALTGYAGGLARKRWLLDHEAGLPHQDESHSERGRRGLANSTGLKA